MTIQRAPLGEMHGADEVLTFVSPSTDPYKLTRVDEADVWALQRIAAGDTPDEAITRVTFSRGDTLVGYASYGASTSDLAATDVALHDCVAILAGDVNHPGHVWIRGVTAAQLAAVETVGMVRRRLAVLVRPLAAASSHDPSDVRIRAFQPGVDDATVVGVLSRAYAGTADDAWTPDAFARRQAYPWFRAEDLLLAENRDGDVLGIHWLKRRDQLTGEVYNLAVDPKHAGRGVGTVLLQAGMRHLAASGLTQMVLWVDAVNEPALRVYRAAGFRPHTFDLVVALRDR